jgi:predicted MPP superfamily phosphohydrolase
MSEFAVFALLLWSSTVVSAGVLRGRVYAIFSAILLGIPSLVASALAPTMGAGAWGLAYFEVATAANLATIMGPPRIHGPWLRSVVSWPASWFTAASFFAIPWAIAGAMGFPMFGVWIPFALAAFGLYQSLTAREEDLHLVLDNEHDAGSLRRHPRVRRRAPSDASARPLRVIQITDPHLGPFMSERRLRSICQRAVEREPDLVLITGDLLTMQSRDPDLLARALSPLRALEGRVFACHGNHDLETRDVVAEGLSRAGAELLIDRAVEVDTPAGRVQILGADYRYRGREEHLIELCRRYPRSDNVPRVVMLHDPGAFRHLPEGEGDLVFSGHTHGGQLGLLSLGLRFTVLSPFGLPDHGLWARGRDRLYVHRAHGHYGFPLRVGVPAENSMMSLYWPPRR